MDEIWFTFRYISSHLKIIDLQLKSANIRILFLWDVMKVFTLPHLEAETYSFKHFERMVQCGPGTHAKKRPCFILQIIINAVLRP